MRVTKYDMLLNEEQHPYLVKEESRNCSERRTRILLTKKRACIYRYYPFTIIVKDADILMTRFRRRLLL